VAKHRGPELNRVSGESNNFKKKLTTILQHTALKKTPGRRGGARRLTSGEKRLRKLALQGGTDNVQGPGGGEKKIQGFPPPSPRNED